MSTRIFISPQQVLDTLTPGKSRHVMDITAEVGADMFDVTAVLNALLVMRKVRKVGGAGKFALWEKLPEENIELSVASSRSYNTFEKPHEGGQIYETFGRKKTL